MADFEDMNATPLGKLPLPAVQSKGDGPRVDMAASYTDILKDMGGAQQQPHQGHQAQQPHHHQGQAQQMHFQQQFQQQFQPPPQQHQYDMVAPQYPHRPHRPHRQAGARRRKAAPVRIAATASRASKGGLAAKLSKYKSSLLVTFVVFLVLMYAAPKLAQAVPQLLTPAGKFSSLGLLLIAAACGGIHRVLDHYVKC